MFTLLALLFTLRTGTFPAFSAPATAISLRAESREAAVHETRYGAPLEPSPWSSAPHAPEFPYTSAAGGPATGPVFAPYRPEEWVARVASHLNVAGRGITHAAMWLLSTPVRVDVSSQHVYVTLTVRAP